MIDRLRSIQDSVKTVGKVREGKTTKLEHGDFTALMIAAWSTFGKTVVLTLLFFAAVIAILVLIWAH